MRANSNLFWAVARERRSNYCGAADGLNALEAQQVAQACLPVLFSLVAASSGSDSFLA